MDQIFEVEKKYTLHRCRFGSSTGHKAVKHHVGILTPLFSTAGHKRTFRSASAWPWLAVADHGQLSVHEDRPSLVGY